MFSHFMDVLPPQLVPGFHKITFTPQRLGLPRYRQLTRISLLNEIGQEQSFSRRLILLSNFHQQPVFFLCALAWSLVFVSRSETICAYLWLKATSVWNLLASQSEAFFSV